LLDLNDTQVLAYFGNLPFLNEDLRDGAVVRAGDLDAGFVALYLTEWLKDADRRPRGYAPIYQESVRQMMK
jgi:hypothetical protein